MTDRELSFPRGSRFHQTDPSWSGSKLGSTQWKNSGRAAPFAPPSQTILPPWETINRGEPRRRSYSISEPHGYLTYSQAGRHGRTRLISRQPYLLAEPEYPMLESRYDAYTQPVAADLP